MARQRDQWLDLFRALGEVFLGVLRAEIAVVVEQGKSWGRNCLIALVFFSSMIFLLFWFLGMLAVALVHALMAGLDLELWQAALLSAGALLLLMAIAGVIGYFLARRYESPVAAARGRFDDNRQWLQTRILGEPERAAFPSEGESDETTDEGDGKGAGPTSP